MNPYFVICKRAADGGMLSEHDAFLEAYTIDQIFMNYTSSDSKVRDILEEEITEEEIRETGEWFNKMRDKWMEKTTPRKERFNLKK